MAERGGSWKRVQMPVVGARARAVGCALLKEISLRNVSITDSFRSWRPLKAYGRSSDETQTSRKRIGLLSERNERDTRLHAVRVSSSSSMLGVKFLITSWMSSWGKIIRGCLECGWTMRAWLIKYDSESVSQIGTDHQRFWHRLCVGVIVTSSDDHDSAQSLYSLRIYEP